MSYNTWSRLKLGDVVSIKGGKRLPKQTPYTGFKTHHPYIRLVDIENGKISDKSIKYIDEDTHKVISRYVVEENDVCLAIVGNTIGVVFYVEKKWTGANLTENAARLTSFKDMSPKYVYYYLISKEGQNEIYKNAIGSAQGKLPIYGIQNIEIPVPPFKIQNRIASVLSSLDDKIELNQQTNQTLEEIAETLFKEMCLPKDDEVPEGWKNIKLSEVVDFIKGVSYRSSELIPSKFALVTLKSINRGGGLNFRGFKEFDGKYKDTQVLQEGDIVIAQTDITQNADVVGCPAIVENPFDYEKLIASIDLVKCKPKDNVFSNEVLFYFLKYQTFKDFCLSHTNGSTVLHLRSSELLNYEFIIPNKKTLDDFGKLVKSIRGKIIVNNKETQTLITLRDSLLPKLMKGEIPIS